MNIPGFGQSKSSPPQSQEDQQAKLINAAVESCPFKTVMAGGAGFGLGAVFGLFMSSMQYDLPGSATSIYDKPFKEQMRLQFKDMGKRSFSSARNFGLVGAIFSGTECSIESYRAKNDIYNGVSAGCITGGVLAMNAGPQAAAIGCVGFAAFSAAIDTYLRSD